MGILDGNFKRKNIIGIKHLVDVIILCVIAFCQYMIIFTILSNAFGGSDYCGDSLLFIWENHVLFFIISLIVLALEVLILFFFRKSRTLLFRVGSWLLVSSLLFPIFLCGNEVVSSSDYYEEFDLERWNLDNEKPIKMIRTIYLDQRYIGKKREFVENDLGEPDSELKLLNNEFVYRTDEHGVALKFRIKEGVIESYTLGCSLYMRR